MDEFRKHVAASGRSDIALRHTGCTGRCSREPIVGVFLPGQVKRESGVEMELGTLDCDSPDACSIDCTVDVLLLAATHADLDEEVAARRFRADLLYRLNTVRVDLPPLRLRRDFAPAVRSLLASLDGAASISDEAVVRLALQARRRRLSPDDRKGIPGSVGAEHFRLERVGAAGVVVNTTPLGGGPGDPLPVPREALRRGQTVMDIVCQSRPTPLLMAARAAGARSVDGLQMLLHQGALACSLWTGREAPLATMRRALAVAAAHAAKVA